MELFRKLELGPSLEGRFPYSTRPDERAADSTRPVLRRASVPTQLAVFENAAPTTEPRSTRVPLCMVAGAAFSKTRLDGSDQSAALIDVL